MLNALRAIARFFSDRVGWNRIGLFLSVAVITVAAVVLYRMLHDIEIDEVVDALQATRWHQILLATVFVALGYFTLTFYDVFALRTIGRRDIPYRVAALAGFTSYSVGHNVGASVFTGGAVRYRIYSYWGLTAVDVAKICFVAGLTFWLGNAAVLGLGILYVPQAASAIDQLPAWLNRGFAAGILVVLVAYVAWVWRAPRQIGRSNWQVTLPNGPLTLLQIIIGIVDLGCCAFAMWVLMPDEPHIGFASHAPGGIGVFDAAMLIALWQFDREDVLAGLLLFRLVYYILPFALTLVILGVRELILNVQPSRPPARAEPAASPEPARPSVAEPASEPKAGATVTSLKKRSDRQSAAG